MPQERETISFTSLIFLDLSYRYTNILFDKVSKLHWGSKLGNTNEQNLLVVFFNRSNLNIVLP